MAKRIRWNVRQDLVTAEFVRDWLEYNKDTGEFFNKRKRKNTVLGGPATRLTSNGYYAINLLDGAYMAHRIAWLHYYGEWPKNDIDHINGIRSDNRICNLRDVTRAANMQNISGAQKNSKSGLLGAYTCARTGMFYSRITTNKVSKYLGKFETAEEAHEAYMKEKEKLHISSRVVMNKAKENL